MKEQQPQILHIEPKLLLGATMQTRLVDNAIVLLWKRFVPIALKMEHRTDQAFYSVQQYAPGMDLQKFTPQTVYRTWAAVEVTHKVEPPEGLSYMQLAGGLYAQFLHYGARATFSETAQYIHGVWMPSSQYATDDRPHFEYLDERYLGPDNPESIEEVWIPVRTIA